MSRKAAVEGCVFLHIKGRDVSPGMLSLLQQTRNSFHSRQAKGDLGKPLISPPFPPLEQNLMNALTPTQSTNDAWEWGYIPQKCKAVAEGVGFSPYDLTVFNIHYTDCSDVNSDMSRHYVYHSSPILSGVDLLQTQGFSREPDRHALPLWPYAGEDEKLYLPCRWYEYLFWLTVLMIASIASLPGTTSAETYPSTGDSVYYGNVREPQKQTLWVHETAHFIDWHNGPTGNYLSSTSAWLNAYKRGSRHLG
ncbi:hypothetical protein B0H66DRAFT_593705 [Apodospora peruviana]|uniref:Lysine-specific metallo-endopeptidase domain-containing protein n=1 Tax=Apodospora peruviana TaxID=516989 RepID=A0AAE0HY76_9PEZI|nr:hypothetical protein B0H66DRAFT_593705 [Apodospora peruviana]